MSELQAALGVAQLERLDQMLADRAKVAGWYREALADLAARTGLGLPCDDRGLERRAAGSCSWCRCRAASTATRCCSACRRRHRRQAVPPADPPLLLLPGARLPRGDVPDLRRHRRPLAGAPVLPGDDAVPGGARGRTARPAASGKLGSACRVSPSRRTRSSGPRPVARRRPPPLAVRRRPVPRPLGDARGARHHQRGRQGRDPRGARGGRAGAGTGPVPVPLRRCRHPHGDRAARHRARRPLGRQDPHGPLTQRPGRHRPRALRARPRDPPRRPVESLARTLLEVAAQHLDWALPGYTHLQRAQPVYLSHTTCSPTSGCSCAIASGSASPPARPTCCPRSAPARSRA